MDGTHGTHTEDTGLFLRSGCEECIYTELGLACFIPSVTRALEDLVRPEFSPLFTSSILSMIRC